VNTTASTAILHVIYMADVTHHATTDTMTWPTLRNQLSPQHSVTR